MKIFLIFLILFFSTKSYTHSGRTNSSGCHNNRKTGAYHCHSYSDKKKINTSSFPKKNRFKKKKFIDINSLHEEARKGQADSQLLLGVMYYIGRGVPKDLKKSTKLFSKSMKKGNLLAKKIIGSKNSYMRNSIGTKFKYTGIGGTGMALLGASADIKTKGQNTTCEKTREVYKKAHLELYKFNKYEEEKMWKYLDKLEAQGIPVDDISASQLAKRDPKYAKHLKKKTTIHDKHQKQKDQYFKICKTKKDLTWKQIIKEWKSQGLLP